MRVLAILALAMLLAGCNGDRMKDGNLQPPSTPAGAELFA
jgi:PBP1b-binding outer membrane lipoprotein LpoB